MNYKHQNGTFTEFLPPQEVTHGQPNGLTMWLDQADYLSPDPLLNNLGEIDNLVVSETTNFDCSNYPMAPLTPGFVISEGDCRDQLPALPECNVYDHDFSPNSYEGIGESSSGIGCYQLCDNGDEGNVCSTFGNCVANNIAPTTPDSWGFQGNMSTPVCRESNVKAVRYSAEERRDRILRYLQKRNQRNFTKTIKYACRKTLADRRVRIRGRFAKNHEQELKTNNSNLTTPQEKSIVLPYLKADKSEENFDDEYWLQDAMSSLMYGPYIPAGLQGESPPQTGS